MGQGWVSVPRLVSLAQTHTVFIQGNSQSSMLHRHNLMAFKQPEGVRHVQPVVQALIPFFVGTAGPIADADREKTPLH